MIKFGIYYLLSKAILPRWEKTLAFQRKVLPQWESIPKVFIMHEDCDIDVPGNKVHINMFRDKMILFANAKNAGLKWGAESNQEWMLDADADCIVVKLPTMVPETGFSQMMCHFQQPEEGMDRLERLIFLDQLQLRYFSRFLIHRSVFTKYRFDEGFYGYGGEDIDYKITVLGKNGIDHSDSGMAGINLWHPMGDRAGNTSRINERFGAK